MKLRHMCLVIMLALTGCATLPSEANSIATESLSSSVKPDVLLVVVDDMRADELKFMPNVQKYFGEQGVTFDRAFSPNSICCPARTTLMTGQYSHNHGVMGNRPDNGGGFEVFLKQRPGNSVFQWLQSAGYATSNIGKTLNGYGYGGSTTYVLPGVDNWVVPVGLSAYRFEKQHINRNGVIEISRVHQTKFVKREVMSFLASSPEKPKFVQANFLAPHDGWTPRHGWHQPVPLKRDADLPIKLAPVHFEANVSDKPYFVRVLEPFSDSDITRINSFRRARAQSLVGVDRAIGSMLGTLDAQGKLDDMLVMFMSDNGYMLGEHRIAEGKSLQYEEATHVPLMIRGPGLASDIHVSALVGLHDVVPTILDFVDVKPRRVQDGVSLYKVIAKPSRFSSRPMLYEIGSQLGHGVSLRNAPHGVSEYVAIRTHRFVLIVHYDGIEEFYDLRNDPYELDNLARAHQFPRIRVQLRQQLSTLRFCKGSTCR